MTLLRKEIWHMQIMKDKGRIRPDERSRRRGLKGEPLLNKSSHSPPPFLSLYRGPSGCEMIDVKVGYTCECMIRCTLRCWLFDSFAFVFFSIVLCCFHPASLCLLRCLDGIVEVRRREFVPLIPKTVTLLPLLFFSSLLYLPPSFI